MDFLVIFFSRARSTADCWWT